MFTTKTISSKMLSRMNREQLSWLFNYMNSIEAEDKVKTLDISPIPNSKAIEVNICYTMGQEYRYIVHLDGIALAKERESAS